MNPFWRLVCAACKPRTGSLFQMPYQQFSVFLAGKCKDCMCFTLWKMSAESCGVLRHSHKTLTISLTLKSSSTHWFCFLLAWCIQRCVRQSVPSEAVYTKQNIWLPWKVSLCMSEAPSWICCKTWEDISGWGCLVCLKFLKQIRRSWHYKCWCSGEKGEVRSPYGGAL